ncbi:GTP-binding protein [Microbacterium hatanonis]|uniref:Cobalamin biosynthesis protein CobW n=1 Tax=Microbacterium hatanonis TaxID=404366 RepID=A0A5C8I1S0_9MICO|nr:GTP-binding protein [Microbacterium hatanonis]TXK11994.1 cobalamin biosynthesis protein CobW [Microbacterium hatanonis]
MLSDPLIIVGVCAPERRRYAERLSAVTGRAVVTIGSRDSTAVDAPLLGPAAFIAEMATEADVVHSALAARTPPLPIVCVVDATHMIDDFLSGDPLSEQAPPGDDDGDHGARARRAASLVEIASLVCLVGWEELETATLSMLMALTSHLNPHARVRLSHDPEDDVRSLEASPLPLPPFPERAGWVCASNHEHDPYMTDIRVATVRYERLRPFHPGRLSRTLDEIDAGRFGMVVRSAGFCRIATRPHTLARWDHVGSAMWIDPLTTSLHDGSTGQDIAFTGIDLHAPLLFAALDEAGVTDRELTSGPAGWRRFDDPLPPWPGYDVTDAERDTR